MKYYVAIIEDATGEIINKIGPVTTLGNAERIESGVDRNINHNEYTSMIFNEDEMREREGK